MQLSDLFIGLDLTTAVTREEMPLQVAAGPAANKGEMILRIGNSLFNVAVTMDAAEVDQLIAALQRVAKRSSGEPL